MPQEVGSSDFKDLFHNRLKDFSTSDFEQAIAEAITKLVGQEFTCELKKVEFKTLHTGGGAAHIELEVAKYTDYDKLFASQEKK